MNGALRGSVRSAFLHLTLLAWLPTLLVLGCGKEGSEEQDDSDVRIVIEERGEDSSSSDLMRIPVSFSVGTEVGGEEGALFSLTSATAYRISLTNCASGYAATVTEAQTDGLETYRYDRQCKAKLTQFTVNGRTYFPTASRPFTTWQVGDTATFDEAGEPGVAPLTVKVLSTLSNPIVPTDLIRYGFGAVTAGTSRAILWSTIGATGTRRLAGNAAPSFNIRKVELLNTVASGAGTFRFTLECTASIGNTNTCATVGFANIDYKLVQDTYNGAPTRAQCNSIFSTAGSTITLPTERIAPGTMGLTNGGFITKSLVGPVTMAQMPAMLLILRSFSASYQYHNVDVNVSVTY